jgi:hypothetical protein
MSDTRNPLDVLAAARAIGLDPAPAGESFGTIEEEVVLETLQALADAHPGAADLFAEAAARVQLARSAGVERIEPGSVFAVGRDVLVVQLRYRSEMAEVFSDLAIDLALAGADHTDEVAVG